MKDIKKKILESKHEICPEVQNEFENDYAYQSYTTTKPKYDYGFLTFDVNDAFYSVTGFNKDSEYAETLASQYNLDVEDLIDLKIGESISDESYGDKYTYSIIRIW